MNEVWKRNLPVPFFSQRENNYQWQWIAKDTGEDFREKELTDDEIKKGIEKKLYQSGEAIGFPISLADSSCNVTCLAMMLHYLGVTQDTPDQIMTKVFEGDIDRYKGYIGKAWGVSEKDGYSCVEYISVLESIAQDIYNIRYTYSSSSYTLEHVKQEIAAGFPVMVSCGIVRPSLAYLQKHYTEDNPNRIAAEGDQTGKWEYRGHYIIIRGFTENGDVIINDPWGKATRDDGTLPEDNINNKTEDAWGAYPANINTKTNNGENIIISQSDFNRQYKDAFHSAMIVYDRRWSFPFSSQQFTWILDGEKFIPSEQDLEQCYWVESAEIHFPITNSYNLHNGIHLLGSAATEVCSIGSGEIVAAKLTEGTEETILNGSNCTILVHHQIRLNNNEVKSFFILYLHLEPYTIEVDSTSLSTNPYRFINEMIEKKENGHVSETTKNTLSEKLDSLRSGKLTVLNDMEEIFFEVAEGDFLGTVGLKGVLPWDAENRCIHVEIFSHENLLSSYQQEGYTELDVSQLSRFNRRELVQQTKEIIFGDYLENFRWHKYGGISSREVERFYRSSQVGNARKLVCKAQSEWFHERDFPKELEFAKGIYEKFIENAHDHVKDCITPYLWWNTEINNALHKYEGVRFVSGIAYYYHPIEFLSWLIDMDEESYKRICPNQYRKELTNATSA